MNGKESCAFILAGVQSVTDLLIELPLPTPIPCKSERKSLLSHLRDPKKASKLLKTEKSPLIAPIVAALSCVTVDNIDVKVGHYEEARHNQTSQLIRYLLQQDPGLFIDSMDELFKDDSASSECRSEISELSHLKDHIYSLSSVSPNQSQNSNLSCNLENSPASPNLNIFLGDSRPSQSIATCVPCAKTMTVSNRPHGNSSFTCSENLGIESSLTSSLQESPQMLDSFVDCSKVSTPLPVVHPYCEGEIDLTSDSEKQNDNTENNIMNNASMPTISLSQISKHVKSTNGQTFGTFVSLKNCSLKPYVEPPQLIQDIYQSKTASEDDAAVLYDLMPFSTAKATEPPQLIQDISQSRTSSEDDVTVLYDLIPFSTAKATEPPQLIQDISQSRTSSEDDVSVLYDLIPFSTAKATEPPQLIQDISQSKTSSEDDVTVLYDLMPLSTAKAPNVLSSESNEEKEIFSDLEIKYKTDSDTSDEKKESILKPLFVTLSKLSLEDQLLAQKSVSQFLIKNKEINSFTKLVNLTTQNKRSDKTSPQSSNEQPFNIEAAPYKCHDSENFSNHKNLELKKDNASVKTHHSSSKKIIDCVPAPIYHGGKRQRLDAHCSNSSYSEEEKSKEFFRDETDAESVTLYMSKDRKPKKKKPKKDTSFEDLSVEDLMNSHAYQRFSRTVDAIFDITEDIDFTNEDAECPEKALVSLAQLGELRNEAAKLKKYHVMNQFPTERLVRLLEILTRIIMDGTELFPSQFIEDEQEEEALLITERVMRSADATLTALYILTSSKMPKKVFFDEVIERIVLFLKFQSQNTIFPSFDPAYRHDLKSKMNCAKNVKLRKSLAPKVRKKYFLQLYSKINEAVSLLAELLESQKLIDTIILQVSMLGVCPFFVEGISELQLNALRLVTTVFAQYDKHRQIILEDLLTSIAKLPTSKRSLRNYRLNSEENIQMFTALVLQLIHSVVRLPKPEDSDLILEFLSHEKDIKVFEKEGKISYGKDDVVTSHEDAVKTAVIFLSAFLKKCGTKKEEMDFRLLFENFVQDLLSTVSKPEWPASVLLLSVLGRILVQNITEKSTEMTLRISSLDYLGIIAAHLRKGAVTNLTRKDAINDIIERMSNDSDLNPSENDKTGMGDKTLILQKALLQYLNLKVACDPALQPSRRFYIAMWYKETVIEARKFGRSLNSADINCPKGNEETDPVEMNKTNLRQLKIIPQIYPGDNCEEKEADESKLVNDQINSTELAFAEERKRFLLAVIKQQEPLKIKENQSIDYNTAKLIYQYLTSTKYLSKRCDSYLSLILHILTDTAVTVRAKAMKSLTLILEADPSILARTDIQKSVQGRLLDQSTSVREAAVDILGKYILIYPELISYYYEMLTARILDTGLSVRKKVIKILSDICMKHPDFPKISEICVKIIRRINDEDSVRKLVKEVFKQMWFHPVSDKRIFQNVKNITCVVEACRDSEFVWFEQLLKNLLNDRENRDYKSVIESCKQIVDSIVENLLEVEEASQSVDSNSSSNLLACLETLHLISKIHPSFTVPHVTTILPYISIKCKSQLDFLLLKKVIQVLELVMPLMEHPSDSFLAQTEEELIKLILRHKDMALLSSCVSCLGAVVYKITHNYQIVKDIFQKFAIILFVSKKEYEKNPENEILKLRRPKLLKSLDLIGLLHCHFDFDAMDSDSGQSGQASFAEKTFEGVIFFNQLNDEDIKLKALTSLGYTMIRHYELMFKAEIKTLYSYYFTSPDVSSVFKCQVLKNVTNFLVEEEAQMIKKDASWDKTSKLEDLKEMCDVSSGMASAVIQIYLKEILECGLHSDVIVRKASLSVIQLIIGQGLVHPVQIVPYLVCLGSDDDSVLQTNADQLLQEIGKTNPGFIQMKAVLGVRMSFKMHKQLIQNTEEIVRGFRCAETPVSRSACLYSVIRSIRQSRRAFLISLLRLFDEQSQTPLAELLYLADNIAYFPYVTQDEPLFIINYLDLILSVSGFNLLQKFHGALLSEEITEVNEKNSSITYIVDDGEENSDDKGDDDFKAILARLPENTTALQECIILSQGCMLLLYLKETLKEMYGFTEDKILQYSPSQPAKVYERPLNCNSHAPFYPETVLNFLKTKDLEGDLDDLGKAKLVSQHLHFKHLMLSVDPPNMDDDKQPKPSTSTLTASHVLYSVPYEDGTVKLSQSPLTEAKIAVASMSKFPTGSRSRKRSKKVSREKIKSKSIKKRKPFLHSASDDSSDSDYVVSSRNRT